MSAQRSARMRRDVTGCERCEIAALRHPANVIELCEAPKAFIVRLSFQP